MEALLVNKQKKEFIKMLEQVEVIMAMNYPPSLEQESLHPIILLIKFQEVL
jgi:hypothetical protein